MMETEPYAGERTTAGGILVGPNRQGTMAGYNRGLGTLQLGITPDQVQSFFPEGIPITLDLATLRKLKTSYVTNYPGEVLDKSNTPGQNMLERVYHQSREGMALKWLPWNQILSIEQEEEVLRNKTNNRTPVNDWSLWVQLMWEESVKLPEGQITGAPWCIQRILTLRRTAYSMVTEVHINLWKEVGMAFMPFYTKRYSNNLRPPDFKEAQ